MKTGGVFLLCSYCVWKCDFLNTMKNSAKVIKDQ
jgi:hypothetical protein